MAVYLRFFLKDITNETFLKHKQAMLRKMEDYLKTTGCRRRYCSIIFQIGLCDQLKVGSVWFCEKQTVHNFEFSHLDEQTIISSCFHGLAAAA